MKVYSLTKLGRRVTQTRTDSTPELKVLHFIRENAPVTEDELEVVGDRWIVRRLVKQKLVTELTKGGSR